MMASPDVRCLTSTGPGIDAVIAARMVGAEGHVTAVDMTPAMLDVARSTADTCGVAGRVTFVAGVIDSPQTFASLVEPADVVVSNGVFNLCLDKAAAFDVAYQLTKPGGVFALADVCREPIATTEGSQATR
jgi:ubiquinone/menaquinone biosynthesis C-methylase UbiE